MQCVCGKSVPAQAAYLDPKTLRVFCATCKPHDAIHYSMLQNHVKNEFPTVSALVGKSVSTRLSLENVIFLAKYAEKNYLGNVSRTLSTIVEHLREEYPLNDVEVPAIAFNNRPPAIEEEEEKEEITISPFLERIDLLVQVEEEPEPEPPKPPKPRPDNIVKHEDDGVFTI